eukprot:352564-Chlamydomonas_euryale.AAC.1
MQVILACRPWQRMHARHTQAIPSISTPLCRPCAPPTHACALHAAVYNPVVKLIYAEDHPLDPSTLMTVRTLMSVAALGLALSLRPGGGSGRDEAVAAFGADEEPAAEAEAVATAEKRKGVAPPADTTAAATTGAVSSAEKAPLLQREPGRSFLLSYTFTGVVGAGVELGAYNFAGTSLQAIGLSMTSATKAGFLVQLTALLVPLLSFLGGGFSGVKGFLHKGLPNAADGAAGVAALVPEGEAWIGVRGAMLTDAEDLRHKCGLHGAADCAIWQYLYQHHREPVDHPDPCFASTWHASLSCLALMFRL